MAERFPGFSTHENEECPVVDEEDLLNEYDIVHPNECKICIIIMIVLLRLSVKRSSQQ